MPPTTTSTSSVASQRRPRPAPPVAGGLAWRSPGSWSGMPATRGYSAEVGPYSDSSQPMRSWPYRFQIGFLPPPKLV